MQTFRKITRRRRLALYIILPSLVAGCGSNGRDRDDGGEGETRQMTASCVEEGELTAEVFGAIETALDWRDDALECDGMPRPHGQGARLRFAGPAVSNGEPLQLAFIIALPDLERGVSADELPAGVTLIEENAGRFFSTPETPACWADIEHQEPLAAADTERHPGPADAEAAAEGPAPEYRIAGLLYCVSPLAEVNGTASITFTDLHFAGRLSWQVPE